MELRALILLAAIALVSGIVVSGVATQQVVEFYDVSGSTAQEIRKDLDRLGPRGD